MAIEILESNITARINISEAKSLINLLSQIPEVELEINHCIL